MIVLFEPEEFSPVLTLSSWKQSKPHNQGIIDLVLCTYHCGRALVPKTPPLLTVGLISETVIKKQLCKRMLMTWCYTNSKFFRAMKRTRSTKSTKLVFRLR